MIARFREINKTKKILKVTKIGDGLTEVQFESKVTLVLNQTEAKVLENAFPKENG